MTPIPTPGQRAYEAYASALNLEPSLTWAIMPPRYRDAWEAAGQAVLVWTCQHAPPPNDT